LNVKNGNRWNPLHKALQKRNLEIEEYILKMEFSIKKIITIIIIIIFKIII